MNLCHNITIFQNLVITNLFTFCSSVDSAVLNRVQQVRCLNQQRRGFQQRSFCLTGSYQQVRCLNQQRRGFQQRSFYLTGSYNEEDEICAMYFAPLLLVCIYFL